MTKKITSKEGQSAATQKAQKDQKAPKKGNRSSSKSDAAVKVPFSKRDEGYTPRLRVLYEKDIRPKLMKERGFQNLLQVPRLEKVVVNVGVGEAVADSKILEAIVSDLGDIVGQKPILTYAKRSIASFKLREGMPIGAKVTLRGAHMYEFLDRLVVVALPRVRDFRGLNTKSFDGRGNYAFGLKEHIVFPEVDYDKIAKTVGMDIVVCTTAANDQEALALLREFNFPFFQRRGA